MWVYLSLSSQVRVALHTFLDSTLRLLQPGANSPPSTQLLVMSLWNVLRNNLDDEYLMTSAVFDALKAVISDSAASVFIHIVLLKLFRSVEILCPALMQGCAFRVHYVAIMRTMQRFRTRLIVLIVHLR